MVRCGFCGLEDGLNDLDDVYSHQLTITADGKSLCPFIDRIDSQIWEKDILPARVAGFPPRSSYFRDETIADRKSEARLVLKSLDRH